MPIKHLRQAEVAQRWNVSPRTLERWRWTGQGPRFLKVGGRVVYRVEDIEAYETEQSAHQHTAARGTRTGGCAMIVLRHKPLVTEIDLCAWLSQAAPADALEYHRGFLVLDIDPRISGFANGDRLELIAVASRA